MPSVDILLATYNGAKFLPVQLASLDAQTHGNWRLILRDDGSSDGSVALVREWAARTKRELLVVEDDDIRVGPGQNFARLLDHSDAPYFAFCDQDDFWHPDKIERLLSGMMELEARLGANMPLLLHCDLAVVGPELQPMGHRFWERSKIETVSIGRSETDRPARMGLVLQNIVTGCATLGNAALRRRAAPVPKGAYLHDWWVAMVAAYLGELHGVAEPLVDYRQHGSNAIGAKAWDLLPVFRRFVADPMGAIRRTRDALSRLRQQTECFLDQFSDSLPDADRQVLAEFAALPGRNLIRRKTFMARYGVHPQSRLRGLIVLCMI